jgi:hypothetical protein
MWTWYSLYGQATNAALRGGSCNSSWWRDTGQGTAPLPFLCPACPAVLEEGVVGRKQRETDGGRGGKGGLRGEKEKGRESVGGVLL